MNFTIKQLRYFDAVLRSGSMARAAQEMNISQSSVIAAVEMVEQVAGLELLRRIPAKGVRATDAGKQVGDRIQAFLEQVRFFESDLRSLSGEPTGTLRIGCYAPTAPYVLPIVIKRIASRFPSIKVELKEGDMQSNAKLLNSGLIDLALTYKWAASDTQPFLSMFHAPPQALVPIESPLAVRDEVELSELADLPMILLDLPKTRAYFGSLFDAQGLKPRIEYTTKSSSVLRGMVASNFGYALLNICGPYDRSGATGYVAKPIAGDLEAPEYGVAYTNASNRSSIVQSVLKACSEIAESGEFSRMLMVK